MPRINFGREPILKLGWLLARSLPSSPTVSRVHLSIRTPSRPPLCYCLAADLRTIRYAHMMENCTAENGFARIVETQSGTVHRQSECPRSLFLRQSPPIFLFCNAFAHCRNCPAKASAISLTY